MSDVIGRVLARTVELLEKGWCARHGALDSEGEECEPLDPDAAKWCLAGAVLLAADEEWGCAERRFHEVTDKAEALIRKSQGRLFGPEAGRMDVVPFNDGRRGPEVLAVARDAHRRWTSNPLRRVRSWWFRDWASR